MLTLQPLTPVPDTIWPNWVVEGEDVGLRVTVENPNSSDVTLDTSSLLELSGTGYSAAISSSAAVPAESQTTLVFRREAIPIDMLGDQLPRLTLNGTDSEGQPYSCTLDLSANVVTVKENGTGLTDPGIPFHPQKPSRALFYPIDVYVQNSSAVPIALDTQTRIEFFSDAGQRAAVTLPEAVTIAAGEAYNLLFDNPRASFAELPLGDYSPVLVCSGTKGGASYSQIVGFGSTVNVNDYNANSAGGGPGTNFLVVKPEGGTPTFSATVGSRYNSEIIQFEWKNFDGVAQADFQHPDSSEDRWIDAGENTARMWYEGIWSSGGWAFHLTPGPDAELGAAYSGELSITRKTPRQPTGGIGIGAGVSLKYTVVFDDAIDLQIDNIVASTSQLVYDVPVEIAIEVSNPESFPLQLQYGGADPTRLVLTDSEGADASGGFQITTINAPTTVPAHGTASVRYQLVPTRSLPLGGTVNVDAIVSSYRDNVYEGDIPENRVTLYDHDVASQQPMPVLASVAAPIVDAGVDVGLREGDTYAAVGECADPSPYGWSATVDYDDGSGAQPLTIAPDLTFGLNHVYPDRGRYTVTVNIDDGHGQAAVEQVIVDVYGPVVYVDASATGDDSGTRWPNAFTDLHDALQAAESGQEVWVADGVYALAPGRSFWLKSGVSVYGGFDGGESDLAERDIEGNPAAILDGQHAPTVKAVNLSEPTTLDGFTIRGGGTGQSGGGIYCAGSPLTISNNVIVGNGAHWFGGGIYVGWASGVVIANNRISANRALAGWGGGIACYRSTVVIEGNQIFDNTTKQEGAGIELDDSSADIVRNVIFHNAADWNGGGLGVRNGSSARLSYNTIADNDAQGSGGGIFAWYKSPSIESSTGNIVWGNSAGFGAEIWVDSPSSLTMEYSDVDLSGVYVETPGGSVSWGPGMIDADPLFADPDNGDYHLKSTGGRFDPASGLWVTDSESSPCIDAGDPAADVGDETAPNGNRINIGAYAGTTEASESGVPPVAEAGGPYSVAEGGAAQLDASATTDPNQDPATLTYEWDLDGDGAFGETGLDAARGDEVGIWPTFSAAGLDGPDSLTVTLRVTDSGGLSDEDTATIDVTNAPPAVDAGPDQTINEGSSFSRSGSFSDPGADTWTSTVDYGDGSGTQPLTLNPDKTFDLSHVYSDDAVYTVTVTVTDDDLGIGTHALMVTVNNVAPEITELSVTPEIDEGDLATLSGAITDPGTADTFVLEVDWGDGSAVETLACPTQAPDLQLSVLYRLDGQHAGDWFGGNVAGAGDVDGDGLDDVVVAATEADPGGVTSAGSVFVLSGSDGSLLYRFDGGESYARLGLPLHAAGDINRDGFADIIAGAPNMDVDGRQDAGSVFVFSGADGSVLHRFDGEASWYTLGFTDSAAGVGDVNADGFPDLVVGTSRACPQGRESAGSVWVYSGQDGSLLHRFDGQAVGAQFGNSASGAGDVNGDGHADIIVGETWGNRGSGTLGTHVGMAYVYSGADGSELYRFEGEYLGDMFGERVAGGMDLNGDAVPDFLVSSRTDWEFDYSWLGLGRVYAFSGADGSLLYYVDGETEGAGPGQTGLAGVADVNGDGFDDFVAGSGAAPEGRGRAYVCSGIDGSPIAQFDGEAPGDNLFWTDGAGDVNGNGLPDFILGARSADPEGRTDAGSVYVVELSSAAQPSVSFDLDHVYGDNGVFTVTLTAKDDDQGVTLGTTTVTVNNVAPTATLANDGPVDEASAVTVSFSNAYDPSTADTAAGLHYSYALSPGGLAPSYAEATAGTTEQFTFGDDGSYTLYARVFDKDGGSSDYTTQVTVNNVAPTVDAGAEVSIYEGETVVQSGSFADPGADEWTATVDYGEGAGQEPLPLAPDKTFTLEHTYPVPGAYTVTVRVSDDDEGTGSHSFSVTVEELAEVSGMAWEDFNNDGEVNFGEKAIGGVPVTLTGTDDRGPIEPVTAYTDEQGFYMFIDLRPGEYTITETQPAEFVDGRESLGTVDGVPAGTVDEDVFTGLVLVPGSIGENYNFGERPPAGGEVTPGQTATIGFWQNKHGQALISSVNDDTNELQLGNWLAQTFPNMYGSLAGKANDEVADFYSALFLRKKKEAVRAGLTGPTKMDTQVMAVALACYMTNETLAGTLAADYGFLVTEHGVGTSTFNVGEAGEAFGISDSGEVATLDLLFATDERSWNGVLYDIDRDGDTDDSGEDFDETLYRILANDVYTAINEQGDI